MNTQRIRAGVVGASGYSGEELVRLLARHPRAELARVSSRSLAGTAVVEAMPRLRGVLADGLVFTESDAQALAADEEVDVWFLALPHGVAVTYAGALVEAGRKVIDLSADFRLNDPALYARYYGKPHPDPELLARARYVIPELAEPGWEKAPLIACPGCYPTGAIVPLAPLLRAGVIGPRGIVINSFSGVSGAGRKVAEAFLYCERDESAKAYGLPNHRHLGEIEEQLGAAAGAPVVVQFNPHLAPMKRGIITTITVPAGASRIEELYTAWEGAYAGRPFIGLLGSGTFPDSAHTVGTNRVDMAAVHDTRTGNYVITSAEDNLLKGAGGQGVQLMNLWFGFEETAGLL